MVTVDNHTESPKYEEGFEHLFHLLIKATNAGLVLNRKEELKMRLADEMILMLEEAEAGMKKDAIYNTDNMQLVWMQYHKDCNSILVSQDGGLTWSQPPFVDSGKWYYKDWLFKLA